MIALRNREKVWVECAPEDAEVLLLRIHDEISQRRAMVVLSPFSVRVRTEDITHAQYFPAKTAPTPDETEK